MLNALVFFIALPLTPMFLNFVSPLSNGTRPWDYVLHGEFPVEDVRAYYWKIYIFDAFTCIATVAVFISIDAMYVATVEHCISLFAIIKHRLGLLSNYIHEDYDFTIPYTSKNEDIAYRRIIDTVKLHKKVIRFADTLESSYSISFLMLMGINMLYCSFVSCLLLIKRDDAMERLRYGGILGGLLIHLFFVSWPGQKLIDHSSGLFNDAYTNEWYKTSLKSQKLLQFMRLRCLIPCQLTAGGIYVMNFENFASIIKTSTSYITVFASFT